MSSPASPTSAPQDALSLFTQRHIRVFVSSTFRDMRAEREELVKRIFPQLRKLCESRGVVWTDVDLRWGVTDEQKAEGHALPICLAEIERCRPYFIGLLGERYGPPVEQIAPGVLESAPWLAEHLAHSLTDLEALHGVLRNPAMAEHAFFYFRDPAYLNRLPAGVDPADFHCETVEQAGRLRQLKERIQAGGFPVHDNYADPTALGQLVLADFTALINRLYPEDSQPSPLDREAVDQEAFATSRARVYIRRQEYFDRLDAHAAGDEPPLVVTGESGVGKSALLANWALEYRAHHPQDLVLIHFIGATPASTDWAAMVRRILGEFDRRLGLKIEVPDKPEALRATFANALYQAAAHRRVVLILDALNQLEDRDGAPDLIWLPPKLPANIRLVVSTLPGRSLDDAVQRKWPQLTVRPLESAERHRLIRDYLAQYTKTLQSAQEDRIADAPQSANPLYLRALLEELRVFGEHERLVPRIEYYLASPNAAELYQRILTRYEEDYNRDRPNLVRDSLRLIWAARRGLSESELLDLLGHAGSPLPHAIWSGFSIPAHQVFANRGGLIGFTHQYVREAVKAKYLPGAAEAAAHQELAAWFERQELNTRKVDELPWQLASAHEWDRLAALLTEPSFFDGAWLTNEFEVKSYWAQIEAASPLRIVDCYGIVLYGRAVDPTYGRRVGMLFEDTGHPREALALSSQTTDYFRTRGDESNLQVSLGCQARILFGRGDLDGAMALYKEEERICCTLSNRHDLSINFGNQAVILQKRGDVAGAMRLLKEQERICRALGFQGGLQASLGNQALILSDYGQLDVAMGLLKEQERICRALGLPDGLSTSLGNQALILRDRGDLDGAMALHKETERIYRALGNLHGLSHSLGNQAVIVRFYGDMDGAMGLLKEEERICRALDDQDGLSGSLGNQAVILNYRGQLDSAMALHKEEEGIRRGLGDQHGLAANLGNQALILEKHGDLDGAMDLYKEAEHMYRALGNEYGLSVSLHSQAVVLRHRGDLEGAIALHKAEERICRALGNPERLALSLAGQSLVDLKRGQPLQALDLVEQAYSLATSHGFVRLASQIQPIVEAARSMSLRTP